jgi:hypothetical protein
LRPELVGQRVELFDEKTQAVFATAEVASIKYCLFHTIGEEDYYGQSYPEISVDEMLGVMKSVYDDEYDMNTGTTIVALVHIELV